MTWTGTQGSHIFQYVAKNFFGCFVQSVTAPATSAGLIADAGTKFALFGNTGTPDYTNAGAGTAALTSYNGAASQWVVANEVGNSGTYAAGGLAVPATKAWTIDATVGPCFTSSGVTTWTGATITAYGGLLYDSTITAGGNFGASQGICFNFFGGAQTVTSGTFTVNWATAGATTNTIFNLSV